MINVAAYFKRLCAKCKRQIQEYKRKNNNKKKEEKVTGTKFKITFLTQLCAI